MKYVFVREKYGDGMIAVECEKPEKYFARNDEWVKFIGLKRNLMFYDGQLEPMSIDMIEQEPDTWSWDSIEYLDSARDAFRVLYHHVAKEFLVDEFSVGNPYERAYKLWLRNVFTGDSRIRDFIFGFVDNLVDLLEWIQ
jgi:hypothetical protein